MLDRNNTIKSIEERMESLKVSETCALFLLAIGKRDQSEDEQVSEYAVERVSSLLARFFRVTDIVGYMGGNQFVAFLSGNLTGNAILDKAGTLSDSLLFAEEDICVRHPDSYVGVYVFREIQGKTFESVYRNAEYALEMARKDGYRHFFVYGADGVSEEEIQSSGALPSSRMLLSYIDEGVRILEVGEYLKPVYVSPRFYRRLFLSEDKDQLKHIRIHPLDQKLYEEMVRLVASDGEPRDLKCRFSGNGIDWISCRIRLLRITVAAGIPVILEISHNISGLKHLKNQYDEKREWLSFVAEETDDQLWEVDLKTRTFRLLYTKNLMDGRQTLYEDFPESLIKNGRIHKDSAESFRRFAERMFGGKSGDSGNFVIQYRQTSCYGWSSMSYHLLYDAEGHPEKAIGIKEDLSYLPKSQSRFIQRRIMPADLYPHLFCYFQANLTQDIPEKLQLEGKEQIRQIRYHTYTEVIEKDTYSFFSGETAKRIQRRYRREDLLQEYANGRRWFFDQCKVVCSNGTIQWVTIGVNLSSDPESGDICLFAYLLDQNLLRGWEASLKKPAVRNPVTGVYDETTFQSLVTELLAQGGQEMCALILIQIGGADELFRKKEELRKMDDIITALHIFLGADCIVGQGEGCTLTVFFPDAGQKNRIRKRLENAFSIARTSLGDLPELMVLRFMAGVAYRPKENAVYEKMASTASMLCNVFAGEPEDALFFSDEDDKHQWDDLELEEQMGDADLRLSVGSQALTDEEKNIALACMDWMLGAENADASVEGVLQRLGAYYQADRVYILILTEDDRIVTMINEWVGWGKYSIQHSISGKRTQHFPVIARAAQNLEPLILSMKKEKGTEEAGGRENWKYAVFPMKKDPDATQLLCIENPRRHIERAALLDQIIPHLSTEHSRFLKRQGNNISALDQLLALPSGQSYQNALYALNSDTCSSLGIMAVDIPELSSLKIQRGYEYGSRFLLRLSEVLLDVFGKTFVFRTQEAEFVALSKNITYEPFFNQCARVRQLVGRKYSGQFRVGCIWSDGIFRARDLAERAFSIMKCAGSAEMAFPSSGEWTGLVPSELPWAKKQVSGRFMIYLQPKVDMRSGKLIGAETLVRVIDEKGNLLSHVHMIEEMEKEGTIQELDYYVFDKTLYTISRWKQKGYPVVPMSSNFSRNTLLNPSSLASVLAILSRYPDVTQELVELEITETAGDYGNQTFSELIRRFDRYGLQFSLDDFGSSYSNLSMLTNLHFHSVKLDRSLIRDISRNEASRTLVRDIVKLCKDCGMTCIAEGVETQEQADILLEDGCLYAQGYYYGHPMPLQEFEQRYFQAQITKEELL